MAHHRAQRCAAAGDHGHSVGRPESARQTHARPRQPDGLREEISLAAVGRHAAARIDRPRARLRRRPAADGRAVRRARRDRARPPQQAIAGVVGAHRQDDLLRHPLDPGGGLSVDQDHRDVAAAGPGDRRDRIDAAEGAPARTFARRRNSWRSPTACAKACTPATPTRTRRAMDRTSDKVIPVADDPRRAGRRLVRLCRHPQCAVPARLDRRAGETPGTIAFLGKTLSQPKPTCRRRIRSPSTSSSRPSW